MNTLFAKLSVRVRALKSGAAAFWRGLGWDFPQVRKIRAELIDYPEGTERNRRLIIFFAALFIIDYLAYSYHTDKNIFDIFPSIPSLDSHVSVSVYLPSLDGESIVDEKRMIPRYNSDEKTAKLLFETVVQGRLRANTTAAVPAELFVRKVWIRREGKGTQGLCVFDIEPVRLAPGATVIKNSEALFMRALEKTITENIPTVGGVMILEKGALNASLWEI